MFHSRLHDVSPKKQEGDVSPAKRYLSKASLTQGMVIGLIGGLLGTIVMDLFGAGIFLVIGGPASLSFSIIGDAAASFFSLMGIEVAGGTPLGAVLHYLIGLIFGALFGVAVSRIATLRVHSIKKGVGLGVLYVELMSLPLLTAAAIILAMTTAETVQWFGVSFVMHLVYGAALGLVVSYGNQPILKQLRRMTWPH